MVISILTVAECDENTFQSRTKYFSGHEWARVASVWSSSEAIKIAREKFKNHCWKCYLFAADSTSKSTNWPRSQCDHGVTLNQNGFTATKTQSNFRLSVVAARFGDASRRRATPYHFHHRKSNSAYLELPSNRGLHRGQKHNNGE